VESFATGVHGAPHEPFQQALRDTVTAVGVRSPRELTARALEQLVRGHLDQFE